LLTRGQTVKRPLLKVENLEGHIPWPFDRLVPFPLTELRA
jgi:hypothetical protein